MLLLELPQPDGRILERRWPAPDYTAPARERRRSTAALREEIERQSRSGWRFTLPVDRILAWLAGEPW
ncbi:MAG TPA: hypothetical protein VIC56_00495 [Gemmatimonadota bacterium]